MQAASDLLKASTFNNKVEDVAAPVTENDRSHLFQQKSLYFYLLEMDLFQGGELSVTPLKSWRTDLEFLPN